MSLISQNVTPNVPLKKKKRMTKEDDVTLVEDEKEETGDRDRSDIDARKIQNRKKVRKENNEKLEIEQWKQMKNLENVLFGSLYSPIEFGKDDVEARTGEVDNNSALFFTDRSANSMFSVYEEDVDIGEESIEKNGRKPVWVDDEEDKANVNIAKVNKLRKLRKEEDESVVSGSVYVSRLRAHHVKMNPGTDWAKPDFLKKDYSSEDDDSDKESGFVDDFLRTNEELVLKSSTKLLPVHLNYDRLVDANVKDLSRGGLVNSVHFHKNAQLLLVGGLDRKLNFFQIDGKKNETIQSIFLEDCPIRKAAFLPDGSKAIVSGRRKFAYSFDLVQGSVDKIGPFTGRDEKSLESFEVSPDSSTIAFIGNEGYILLVSTKTKQLIGTLKMNGTVRSIAFSNDGQKLLSNGGDGHIYHWDLRTRTCLHKGADEGCLNGTSLGASPRGKLFAAGSDTGIVNIYNEDEFLGGKRKPLKVIENLTTKVDCIKFNWDGQLLAIISRKMKNGMKLIHVPSLSVLSNWPPPRQVLQKPRCVDFSPGGGLMAIGKADGKVLLYRLLHYHQA